MRKFADGAIRDYTINFKGLISARQFQNQLKRNIMFLFTNLARKDRQFAYIVAGIAGIIALYSSSVLSATRKGEEWGKRTTNYIALYPELNYSMDSVLEDATMLIINQESFYTNNYLLYYKNLAYDLTKS